MDILEYWKKRAEELKKLRIKEYDPDGVQIGWIDPEGVYYECEFGEHSVIAEYLLQGMGIEDLEYGASAIKGRLLDMGWLQLSSSDVFGINNATQKQIDVIGAEWYTKWLDMFGDEYHNR